MSTDVLEQLRRLANAFDECVDDLTVDEILGGAHAEAPFGARLRPATAWWQP